VRGLELDPDVVAREVELAAPVLVGLGQPARADHRQRDVAALDRLLDGRHDVLTRHDPVRIEHDVDAVLRVAELLGEPPRVAAGIAAPVADEHRGQVSEGTRPVGGRPHLATRRRPTGSAG
jgi:hypothetical protein